MGTLNQSGFKIKICDYEEETTKSMDNPSRKQTQRNGNNMHNLKQIFRTKKHTKHKIVKHIHVLTMRNVSHVNVQMQIPPLRLWIKSHTKRWMNVLLFSGIKHSVAHSRTMSAMKWLYVCCCFMYLSVHRGTVIPMWYMCYKSKLTWVFCKHNK